MHKEMITVLVRGLLNSGTIHTFTGGTRCPQEYANVVARILELCNQVDACEPQGEKSPAGTVDLNFMGRVGFDALDPSTDLRLYSLIALAIGILDIRPSARNGLTLNDPGVFLSNKDAFSARWTGANASSVDGAAKAAIEAVFAKAGLKGEWIIEFNESLLLSPECMEGTSVIVTVGFPLEATGCEWDEEGRTLIVKEKLVS